MINLDTVVKARLKDGHYRVTLKDYEAVNNNKGGYIRLDLQFPDRVFSWVVFPNQFEYVTNMLKAQFGWDYLDKTYREIFEHAKVTPFNIWTSFNEEYSSRNYSLSAPKEETAADDLPVSELVTF